MSVRRQEPRFWSSCCGERAEYIGYYRCTGCTRSLHMGRDREPHLVSSDGEAARIREAMAAAAGSMEEVGSGRLF